MRKRPSGSDDPEVVDANPVSPLPCAGSQAPDESYARSEFPDSLADLAIVRIPTLIGSGSEGQDERMAAKSGVD